MKQKTSWNDYRLILAIERAGSLGEAGKALGLSHATVFRHLNAIEKCLGLSLFVRGVSQYEPTAVGRNLASTAAEIETRIIDAESAIYGDRKSLTGRIRVTTTDTLLYGLFSSVLADFQAKYPDVTVELSVSNDVFNLTRRDADVAIRPGRRPNETLVGRRIGAIELAPYARADLASFSNDQTSKGWIGAGADAEYKDLARWMSQEGLISDCRLFTNSLLASYAAVVDGLGRAILPCYLGDNDKRLTRVCDPVPELNSDLWLLTAPELKDMPTVRTFNDFVFTALRTRLKQTQVDT